MFIRRMHLANISTNEQLASLLPWLPLVTTCEVYNFNKAKKCMSLYSWWRLHFINCMSRLQNSFLDLNYNRYIQTLWYKVISTQRNYCIITFDNRELLKVQKFSYICIRNAPFVCVKVHLTLKNKWYVSWHY